MFYILSVRFFVCVFSMFQVWWELAMHTVANATMQTRKKTISTDKWTYTLDMHFALYK